MDTKLTKEQLMEMAKETLTSEELKTLIDDVEKTEKDLEEEEAKLYDVYTIKTLDNKPVNICGWSWTKSKKCSKLISRAWRKIKDNIPDFNLGSIISNLDTIIDIIPDEIGELILITTGEDASLLDNLDNATVLEIIEVIINQNFLRKKIAKKFTKLLVTINKFGEDGGKYSPNLDLTGLVPLS